MQDFETLQEEREERWRRRGRHPVGRQDHGHIWTGILFLIVGGVALLKSFQFPIPDWLFNWQSLLIVLGLFIGVKHNFRGAAWFIMMLIGGAFLINDYVLAGDLHKHIWPIVIIAIGAFFVFRPRHRNPRQEWKEKLRRGEWGERKITGISEEASSKEDFIDVTSIFGSTKKNILSKNFIGGDITNIFGGTELNLTQADIQKKAVLDVTTLFGGAELIIPSHWSVVSEVVTIFGGVEDKRTISTMSDTPEKILIIKGTIIFGGIEIKSFKKAAAPN